MKYNVTDGWRPDREAEVPPRALIDIIFHRNSRTPRSSASRPEQEGDATKTARITTLRVAPEPEEDVASINDAGLSTKPTVAAPAKLIAPTFNLPAAATEVIGQVLRELSEATSDEVRERKAETLVLIAKDFCDAVTFIGEASAQYQQHMSLAAENRSIIAGHDRDSLARELDIDILQASHEARKRARVADAETEAVEAEARLNGASVHASDRHQSIQPDAVRQRMFARQTVTEAALGYVTITHDNYYRGFARLLYDHFAERHDGEVAVEKAAVVLAARMNEEDFDRATGSEFYNLFTKRRADAAREKLDALNAAARASELSHEVTLARLKTDEEQQKAQRIQNLKELAGHGNAFDPTV
jgi:hypothetical protein